MTKWQYKTIEFSKRKFVSGKVDIQLLDQRLNELGEQGWELVSMNINAVTGWGGLYAVLKRPL